MLITSTWSEVSPSPFGSAAISIAAATLAELVDPRAKTLKIRSFAPGATPWETFDVPIPAGVAQVVLYIAVFSPAFWAASAYSDAATKHRNALFSCSIHLCAPRAWLTRTSQLC